MEKDNGNSIEVRLHDQDENQISQTLNIKNYNSKEELNNAVKKLAIELSYKAGKTKNLIKIIDDNTIEVTLTQGEVMRIDKVFIPLIENITICTSMSGNGIKYALVSNSNINKLLHGLITGFDMVDHIDGITLNNTLKNLRYCNTSMNNSNRHTVNNKHDNRGIKLEDSPSGPSWVARIKINEKTYSKYYKISKYGNDDAKKLAVEFRKKAENVTKYISNLTKDDNKQLLIIEEIKLENTMSYIRLNTIFDKNKYLSGIILDEKDRTNMHLYYLNEQMKYYQWCKEEYDRITRFLANKLNKNNDSRYLIETKNLLNKIGKNRKNMSLEDINTNPIKLFNICNDEIMNDISNNELNNNIIDNNILNNNVDENINDDDILDDVNVDINNNTNNNPLYNKVLKIIEVKDGELIKGTFNSRHDIITIKCKKDDNVWTTKISNILRNLWCPECGTEIDDEQKEKISTGMKKFNATEKGKVLKKESHIKRSETMKNIRDEIRTNITEKQCNNCEETKPKSEFSIKSHAKDGLQPNCKSCVLKLKQEWRQKQRDKDVKKIS